MQNKKRGDIALNNSVILSICIPSYNRPDELYRLLRSIDVSNERKIEIVIREDMAPKRTEVREKVHEYQERSNYAVRYVENEENYGYDKNIRNAADIAQGKWVMFMGDDDIFIKGSLDKYLEFLESHSDLGYVLRRYRKKYHDGRKEEYRYSRRDEFFAPGEDSIVELFRRSLFISGVTFRKECFSHYSCRALDGTLLFQLYIQACVCQRFPSAYCDIPITESIEGGIPYFGKSNAEKGLYQSGKNTFQNSINFLKQVKVVTEYFDSQHQAGITDKVLKSYSKYSYGYLLEHRDDGRKVFRIYAREIKRIGLGASPYFYIYYYALYILGRKNCQNIIIWIKKIYGKTPRL